MHPNSTLDGRPLPEQTPGDCNQVVCQADGTTRSVEDDEDLPPPAPCLTRGCVAGAIVDEPLALGAACQGGVCDGEGRCVEGAGVPCASAEECASGHCVDGVCCNTACADICKTCATAGAAGICGEVPYYREEPWFLLEGAAEPGQCNIAIGGAVCDGQGNCRKMSRVLCLNDEHCISGHCGEDLRCLGTVGELCNVHVECVSGTCAGGACE